MEEELLPQGDLQLINQLSENSPSQTGYEAYKTWSSNLPGNITASPLPVGEVPTGQFTIGNTTGNSQNGRVNTISERIAQANAGTEDSTKYSIKAGEISKRYPVTFKDVDNEELYAGGQTLGEKAYNGVAKMVGTATTTFINGTVGTVYGIMSAASAEEGHKIKAFYDNDLSNYLNNVNESMEDTYAHYKTERERNGDWWEPGNLFTANFLFDNIIKNLGFSVGAMGAGFAWGGALKVIGLTGRLVGSGSKLAAAADTAIAEATLLPKAQRLSSITESISKLYNSSKVGLGEALMKADRGIVATFGTFGESGIEALNNSQQFREAAIQAYKDEHGYAPDEEEIAKINAEAEYVGNWSFGLNTALLTATNYIQLPKIYSSAFKSEKTLANNIALAGDKYVSTLPKKGIGRLMYKAANLGSLAFNTSEAFEEGAQYAIQTGTQNYFDRKYRSEKTSALEDGLLYGVKEALTSNEGTLNIFTGGFSGALQSSGIVGIKNGLPVFGQTGKIGERGFTGYGGEQDKVRKEAITALNNTMIKNKMRDVFSNIQMAEEIQADREAAIRRGDILQSKDLEFDYAHSFVSSRLKYGAKEAINNEINILKEQAIKDFTSLQQEGIPAPTDTKETFIARLDNLKEHSENAAQMYDAANLKYSGLVNKEGKKVYTDEVIDKLVYAGAKVMDYNRRIPQMQNKLTGYDINLKRILDDIIAGKPADEAMFDAQVLLESEGGINSDDLITTLEDVIEASLRRKNFIEEYKEMTKNPQKYQQTYQAPSQSIESLQKGETEEQPTGKKIQVVTKGGAATLYVGKEYILGRVVEKDKNGYEVYRAPKLTIIGENEDGTIKVQLSSGLIRDINKEDLEDYKLVSMDTIEGNKKLQYFMANWNSIFEHFGIKQNGKPVKGRLEYTEKDRTLLFVYKDKRGKVISIEVTGSMFNPANKKYKHGIIKKVGDLTPAEQQIQDEFVAEKDDRAISVIEKRMAILIELSDSIIAEQEKTQRLIDTKVKQLESYKKELANLEKILAKSSLDKRYKNTVRFKKVSRDALKRAMDVSRAIEQLKQQVEIHESSLEDMDNALTGIENLIDDIENQPVELEDFMVKLRYERIVLVDTIQSAAKNINFLQRAIKAAEDLLASTVKIIRDVIDSFERKYPGAPTSITEIERRNPDFLKLNPNFKSDLETFADELDLMDEVAEVDIKEKSISDLNESLDNALKEFKFLEKQLASHDIILNKFREVLNKYRAEKREELALAKNEKLKAELLGTNSVETGATRNDPNYEPEAKKSWNNVVSGTTAPNDKVYDSKTKKYVDAPLREHHKRANRFGIRMGAGDIPLDTIHGYIVTKKTEELVGVPGLTMHLAGGNEAVDEDNIIAMVMVKKNLQGEYQLVDEFGNFLSEEQKANPKEHAIYQVFPKAELTHWSKGQNVSMFREDVTPEQIAQLKTEYAGWRETILKQDTLAIPEIIDASFGVPEYVIKKDSNGFDIRDYDARTSVKEAGLLDNEQRTLLNQPVIHVATLNTTYQQGTTVYNAPLGFTFFQTKTGAVRLQNKKFNKKEAQVIFDVILQLTKNMTRDKTLKTGESDYLMKWLKSVVYWGIPKDENKVRKENAGYNSIWFENKKDDKGNIVPKLFISGRGLDFPFTEAGLRDNQTIIMSFLEDMYGNTEATRVNNNSFTNPYFEITGLDSEGKPIETKWPNYQSFLLSDKRPDGTEEANLTEHRNNNEIPLVTNMAPIKGDSTNRSGIYFIRRNTTGTFTEPIPVASPAPKASVATVSYSEDENKRKVINEKRNNNMIIVDSKGNKITRYDNIENLNKRIIEVENEIAEFKNEDPLEKAKLNAELDNLKKTKTKEENNIINIERIYAEDMAKLSQSTTPSPAPKTKVTIRDNSTFVPLPGQYDLSGPAINTYSFPNYGNIRFRMNGARALAIIKEKSLELNPNNKKKFITDLDILIKTLHAEDAFKVDIPQEVATPMMQAIDMTDPNVFTMAVMDKVMQKVLPQLSSQNTPVEPALDNPVPQQEIQDKQPNIIQKKDNNVTPEATPPVSASNLFGRTTKGVDYEASIDEDAEMFTMGDFAAEPVSTPPETGEAIIASVTEIDPTLDEDEESEENALKRALEFKKNLPLRDNSDENEIMRAILERDIESFKPENWEALTEWLSKNFPNVPVFRVKNIIKNTNGKEAWGLFQDGAIYVYENAEIGTIYHEVFEAVWKMFADPEEKVAIVNEFRDREGDFIYAFSGERVKYSEATDEQVRETIAEEFRDFVQFGINPVRKEKRSIIGKLFEHIVNIIEYFFTSKKAKYNTKKLFDKIGNGYYAKYNPYKNKLALAGPQIQTVDNVKVRKNAVMRLKDVPEIQAHEVIEHMTYKTLTWVLSKRQNIFKEEKENKAELYKMLKEEILGSEDGQRAGIIMTRKDIIRGLRDTGKKAKELANKEMNDLDTLWIKLFTQWPTMVERHQLYLKQKVQLTFDENDEIEFNEEKSNKAFEGDARKIDTFRKANSMIRLMLSTLPRVTPVETTKIDETGKTVTYTKLEPLPTSVGGNTLIPSDEVFINLMNELHKSTDPVQMINTLGELGQKNSSYGLLYQRITKNPASKPVSSLDLSQFDDTQIQLLTAFWKTMKKAKPNVVAIYIFPGGEVSIGDASLASAAKRIKKDFINNAISGLKSGPYLTYNVTEATYNPTPAIKNLSFDQSFGGMIAFLNTIGIEFTPKELASLNTTQKNIFRNAVLGMRKTIAESSDIKAINTKSLSFDGNMMQLATLKASLNLKNKFESTYFNINGERTQAFIGTNVVTDFYDVISSLGNINDLIGTKYSYLLTDVFTNNQASILLNKIFDIKGDGRRRDNTEELLKSVDVSGIIDEDKGKKKESSKLSYKQRFIQEMNLNINGIYLNLVPGDASIEHAITMHTEKTPFVTTEEANKNNFLNIFKNYFISEVLLSRDNRKTVNNTTKNAKNLRFFKDILPEEVHTAIISDSNTSPEKLYQDFEAKINSALIEFIEQDAQDTNDLMEEYDIIGYNDEGMTIEGIDFHTDFIDQQILKSKLKAVTINYMIANIEMHKLYYSDPYQYKDELKRIKNFNSPRQSLFHGSEVFNTALDASYNRDFNKNDIGWSDMYKEWFDTVTFEDVISINEDLGYTPFESTDGGGIMYMNAFRIMRIRASNWTDSNELQWRYDIAYEKTVKGLSLSEDEKAFDIHPVEKNGKIKYIGKNPSDQSTYTTQKPIVSGSKLSGRGINDVVMDKYALMPLSFRVLHEMDPDSNAIKLYNKMQKEKLDYGVYASGRKVGTEIVVPLYDSKGNFDEAPFRDAKLESDIQAQQKIVKVPFSIMGIQAEVPSKATAKVTEGTQITQLATLDYMQAGIPIDFEPRDNKGTLITDFNAKYDAWNALPEERRTTPLFEEIKRNQKLLVVRLEQGYKKLLKKTGISEREGGFVITDKDKLIRTISDEILSREVNENIISTFEGIKDGDVILEATPAYKQIRNALYAMADKNVLSKKITGRMAVQVSAALLETPKGVTTKVIKNSKGEEIRVYQSDALDFYSAEKNKDGKIEKINVCEVMIARWFDSPLSDEELITYLNETPEGQKILEGVAFRIPTQKQNSIDAYKIKKFLPREFGDNVVIPTELVMKVGSDFDIDKLSMYFKNVRVNKAGYPELITLLTDENSTVYERYKKYIADNFDDLKDIIDENKKSELGGKVSQAYNNIDSEKVDLKNMRTLAETTYSQGRVIFSNLPISIKQDFWNENERLKELDYDLLERIVYFRMLAKKLVETNKDTKILKTLNSLIENYTETLKQYGVVEDLQDKVDDSYIKAKGLSNQLRDAIANAIAEKSGLETIEEFSKKDIYSQNTRDAVDNAYMQSLFNLISDPLNFERLIIPNSAQPLKDLNDEIGELTGRKPTDYSSVGNMLRRRFMSSLRHAFVTGKYAIGIAAISQTNHSQNQRSLIYTDIERLGKGILSVKDEAWLGDGEIKFKEYNTVEVNGRKLPTLSMVKNAAGEYISDIIGMFIDGYVDISKGPWIMEMGATPNVAGTWLYLIKLGVPVNTVAYFMNQPIIRDYLKSVESAGYSYLFMDNFVDVILNKYGQDDNSIDANGDIPSDTTLKQMMKSGKNLTPAEQAFQRQILKEFLKYAKMAEHLFLVTQGTNYNTATLNDPFLIYQKEKQYEKSKKTIISSSDNILDNSHIGSIRTIMKQIRNAFSTILISDRYKDDPGQVSTREVLENVLDKYIDLQPKEFLKVAQKLVNNLFDWAVQTAGDTNTRNTYIKEILVGDESIKSVAEQLMKYKHEVENSIDHPLKGNSVLDSLSTLTGDAKGKVNNLFLVDRDNKVYDQNIIINSFRELREQLRVEGKISLYHKLVGLSILQSGLNPSPINFTALLPYEDFVKNYQDILSKLENNPNLAQFSKLKAFERNSWSNTDIVPFKKFFIFKGPSGKWLNPNLDFRDKRLVKAMGKSIPMVINVSIMSREGNSDIITYSWQDSSIKKAQKALMRQKSDYSYIKKGLFQKVYTTDENGNPTPLIQIQEWKGRVYKNYVYKAINAWGDSFKAQEFYTDGRKSVLDNGYLQVNEVSDDVIVNVLNGAPIGTEKTITTTEAKLTPQELSFGMTTQSFDDLYKEEEPAVDERTQAVIGKPLFDPKLSKVNIYAGARQNEKLSNFALRLFKYKGSDLPEIMFKSVEIAFQKSKIAYAASVTEQPLDVQLFLNDPRPGISSTEAKALGRKIVGLRIAEWDANSSRIMKDLIKQSFEQNPKDLEILLATGNAELTHTQDKGKWGTEFPKLLMEVRQELSKKPVVSSNADFFGGFADFVKEDIENFKKKNTPPGLPGIDPSPEKC